MHRGMFSFGQYNYLKGLTYRTIRIQAQNYTIVMIEVCCCYDIVHLSQ